jgi:hypothetical protein
VFFFPRGVPVSLKRSIKASFILLALCLVSAPAGGEVVFNRKLPLRNIRLNPCSGEVVGLEGEIHFVVTETTDSSGGVHFTGHSNYQNVYGIGLDSGEDYRLVNVTNSPTVEHAVEDGASVITSTTRLMVIGPGKDNNYTVTGITHLTVNNNGEITSVKFEFESGCQ